MNPANSDNLVYAALWQRRVGDHVRMPLKTLVTTTGLSERTARRSLRRLCDSGRLTWLGREEQSSVFRFSKNSSEQIDGPVSTPPYGVLDTRTDQSETARRSAAVQATADEPAAPLASADLRLTEEERELGIESAYEILTALHGLPDPDLSEGECGECGGEFSRRWRFGAFALCYRCRNRRQRVLNELLHVRRNGDGP